MSGRVALTGLVLVLLALGWLAAGSGLAWAEQAAAVAAAGLVVAAIWKKDGVLIPEAADAAAVVLAAAGLLAGWAWPAALALGWVMARRAKAAGTWPERWAALGLLAVPWLAVDAAAVGWLFRLSGAWTAEGVFGWLGLAVTRDGTLLRVEDLPLAVDAACAGLDTLQATAVAGVWLAETLRTRRAWWVVATLLPVAAWLANTARIVVLGAVATSAGTEAAEGVFHTWGGLGVIGGVFALVAGLVAGLKRWERGRT